ncbi:hypothetical protein GH742_11875 [Legionella sp. MW5194]|uniref:hypothetical protein n=1 Tax=Legionella sp. MW5194 TaxID=2662448 RepID=UPI00193D6C69|nr:hypothetical protein [Legionella sp. MW5194]QRN04515.1 hypothetical protein GH742_11875 [Legionella sp. MW5194]
METNEHKSAGNQIRIQTFGNPYLQGSKNLSPDEKQVLKVQMMRKVDGIPMPLDLQLSAGDIVALAGDYYTKAGWGLQLKIPQGTDNREVITDSVSNQEYQAFRRAYENLASPDVKKSTVDRIYAIENSFLPSVLQQAVYALVIPEYGNKLVNNEAHFSPWSLRAYIVGHRSALRMAKLAYQCRQLAEGQITEEQLHSKLAENIRKIRENKSKYGFAGKSDHDMIVELGQRYHAMAVARDLFAMHFYSDHFAAGHLSRMGRLRTLLPERFKLLSLGSILVNNMHNEDNADSITATNPFTPVIEGKDKGSEEPFAMLHEDNKVYGDGTYFERSNDANSNMLVNGMDNSLGDIARLLHDGTMREQNNYGGLTFLPEIDSSKPQPQPLFIAKGDDIYYRKNPWIIKQLNPADYEKTINDPESQDDYGKLTAFQAFLLVLKLRVGGLIYSTQTIAAKTEAPKPAIDEAPQHESQAAEKEKPKPPARANKVSWQKRAEGELNTLLAAQSFFRCKDKQQDVSEDALVSTLTN